MSVEKGGILSRESGSGSNSCRDMKEYGRRMECSD